MAGKLILMRHGEKADPFALCSTGMRRSLALAEQYLGQGASKSLFNNGEKPDAFFAVTLHTLETASPAAQSWRLPVICYSAVPINGSPLGDSPPVLQERTRQAAADMKARLVLGQIVVAVWEHHCIADPNLAVTLCGSLGLQALIPGKWQGENYNYFWIFDYAGGSPTFDKKKQKFDAAFADLPDNEWGEEMIFPAGSDCES
jgi:hypothetical protein